MKKIFEEMKDALALKWYWLRFSGGLRITVHLEPEHHFRWTRILGVQLGPWFFGAIRGRAEQPQAVDGEMTFELSIREASSSSFSTNLPVPETPTEK